MAGRDDRVLEHDYANASNPLMGGQRRRGSDRSDEEQGYSMNRLSSDLPSLPPGASTPQPPQPMLASGGDLVPSRAAPLPPFSFAPQSHSGHSTPQPDYPPVTRPERSAASTPVRLPKEEFTTVPLNDDLPYGTHEIGNGPGANAHAAHGRSRSKLGFAPLGSIGGHLDHPSHTPAGGSTSSFTPSPPNEKHEKRPKIRHRNSSWNELEWEGYNPATAKNERLRFAEGDAGTSRFSRMYLWALNKSIFLRWTIMIVPFLALLWIPGIVGITAAHTANIWGVKLLWWSIWLTVVWLGFWGAKAAFMMFPAVWKQTVVVVVPTMQKYTDVARNLGRYAKLVVWSLVMYVSYQPLIDRRFEGDRDSNKYSNISLIANLLFGFLLCMIVYALEKLIVQLIALQFHRDSYADRLAEQKANLKALTTLYIHTHDIPGRRDTLTDTSTVASANSSKVAIRKALKGIKSAAQSTTNALGNVATEMAGSSVLQTNSPTNKVTAAISSANKSRALGRRFYYSFRKPGVDHVTISDIARFFPSLEQAEAAFAIFDRDGNGDATRDEIDSSMLELHRERMSLEASMRDLDGAVRRLDDILMILVFGICVLIMSAMITKKVTTFVTSMGTFILSLSWMIGTTMQEVLLACIFLFVKHPYDVGDRVDIDGNAYTVAKMELMSTSFKRVDGKFVWIGHNVLALKVIENVRRSGPTSETFVFSVAFDTTFEKLQALRVKMLKFCQDNPRDFQPAFDVIVDDFPDQGKMQLKADIKYKSNWQQGALKVQRRNKWVCNLKLVLRELAIWGPGDNGDPNPPPADPTRYTLVPWEQVQEEEHANRPTSPPPTFATATGGNLFSRRHDSSLDLWGEDLHHDDSAGPSRMPSPGPDQQFRIGTPPPRTAASLPVQAQAQSQAQAQTHATERLHGNEGQFRPGGYAAVPR